MPEGPGTIKIIILIIRNARVSNTKILKLILSLGVNSDYKF